MPTHSRVSAFFCLFSCSLYRITTGIENHGVLPLPSTTFAGVSSPQGPESAKLRSRSRECGIRNNRSFFRC